MVELLKRESLKENLKETAPALAILLVTLVISPFIKEFTFSFGTKALWQTLLRFLRLSLLLTLPLFLLPSLFMLLEGFFKQETRRLIQMPEDRDPSIHALKNWIVRPFQGIGLAMLLATKLLTLLEIYTGNKITADTLLPQGTFNLGHFISSITIGVVVSLLLSFIWALDDLGIRYYNKRTKEVRMIGKYVGLLLPIFFGFYGIIGLFHNHSQILVAKYVAQMVVVLYPPFVVFSIFHSRYLKSREEVLLRRLRAVSGGIMIQGSDLTSRA